jgi:hypothetical protein
MVTNLQAPFFTGTADWGAPIKRLSSGNMEFDSRKARER